MTMHVKYVQELKRRIARRMQFDDWYHDYQLEPPFRAGERDMTEINREPWSLDPFEEQDK